VQGEFEGAALRPLNIRGVWGGQPPDLGSHEAIDPKFRIAKVMYSHPHLMNLTIKPELESFIQKEILAGKYTSPDEVIEAALSLLEHANSRDSLSQELGEKIDIATAQINRGEGLNGEEVIANLRAKLKAAKEAR
jgi:antitoxin ParD1/3/4